MTNNQNLTVVIIGSGNVAWHITKQMLHKKVNVLQLYSPHNAKTLAEEFNLPYTDNLSLLKENADMYLFSIKDDAYQDVIAHFPYQNKCMIHTSGSVDINVFQSITENRGVLYPFQTFTKNVDLSFEKIPLCLEAGNQITKEKIEQLAKTLSDNYHFISSEQRKQLHLAGVFACNFTNAMYRIAKEIVEKNGMDFSILLALIEETARKVQRHAPGKVQTGPAIRNDKKIMQQHLAIIENKEYKLLYQTLSSIIQKK
ncbi:MAG TPA: DUF2520 domain-containing protein [Bacteroidales bacterium]|nr:DUF2520 domain-containing protein [Bacteroidales bacterium]HOR82642.1 DUF2520 domain-containing protein [Bacteroidales bacterium]HPJ91833.1 DUF2520 domain-containing protein [Bacteroidales bacterium]